MKPLSIQERDAIDLARKWVACRTEVRRHLIALAREANPVDAQLAPNTGFAGPERWPNNEIRKLRQFPHDLSEERLLALIDNGKATKSA